MFDVGLDANYEALLEHQRCFWQFFPHETCDETQQKRPFTLWTSNDQDFQYIRHWLAKHLW